MERAAYCTREDVMAATDVQSTARTARQIDSAILAATESIRGLTHRLFYPWKGTRYFDYPNASSGRSWILRFDEHALISLTSLTAGGTSISASGYYLEPANSGPPYRSVEINLASSSMFNANQGTHQRAIAVTGLWGETDDQDPAGVLESAVSNATTTTVDVTDVSLIGVGSVLTIDSERMVVTAKSMLDTGQNQVGTVTASVAVTTVQVASGAAFQPGEVIMLDAERMLIVDIAGNNLIVKRGWDGSQLAAHTTADVYAPRRLTVRRAALGTTGDSHSDAATITVWRPPALITELAVAYALVRIGQRQAGYARTIGSGENERESSGRGLKQIEDDVYRAHGRKGRVSAI